MFTTTKPQVAGAVCSAMEQRPFQKRVQLKNQRSRGNFTINLLHLSICAVFCICFSISCATGKKAAETKELIEKTLNSWVGAHISQLIAHWGPENRTSSDGNGGTIYTWERMYMQESAYYNSYGVYQPPVNRYVVDSFYVNANGIIYSWRHSIK